MSPLKWFICPRVIKPVLVENCLQRCDDRCLTLPTLKAIADERVWNGRPSTTQLLNGTMLEFLKITKDYAVDPQDRAFALLGTRHHQNLDAVASTLNLPSEIALSPDGRDVFDLLEPENGSWTLTDYKAWGSYRVVRALGIVEAGKKPDPSGETYRSSGKWGAAGSPKMVATFQQVPQEADLWEAEMQLNHYRIMLEERGIQVGKMQLQVTVRDGGIMVAKNRGIDRNMYLIPIKRLGDNEVFNYFHGKKAMLLDALEAYNYDPLLLPSLCNNRECWDGNRCRGYCEVAEFCPKGLIERQ